MLGELLLHRGPALGRSFSTSSPLGRSDPFFSRPFLLGKKNGDAQVKHDMTKL